MAVKKQSNPIDDFFNFIGKTGNAINSFKTNFNNSLPTITTPANSFLNKNVVAPVKDTLVASVKSIPFNLRTSARSNPPADALSINTKSLDKQFNQDYQTYQKATPVGKLGLDSILGEGSQDSLIKGQSGQLKPYIRDTSPAPQSDPYLEKIKMKVLSNPNLTPQAKEYLSKIPISYKQMDFAAGQSYGSPENGVVHTQNPYVAISDTFNKPITVAPGVNTSKEEIKAYQDKQLEIVIAHELNHQTPRLVPVELFHPKNKVIINDYVQRWGKDYMKRPGALVEEMFAEKALPPAYYWHVFKDINPNANQQDFVGYLKSFFINKVNTPAPVQNNTGWTNLGPGTMVPNSGGGVVQQ